MRRTKSNWFCIKVRDGAENSVATRLQTVLDDAVYRVRVPLKRLPFMNQGQSAYRLLPSFPGLIFVVTEQSREAVRRDLWQYMHYDDRIYGFLHYGDDYADILMSETDKAILLALYNDEFIADTLKAIKVGDRVEITDEFFAGSHGAVTKMIKHRKIVYVEFDIFGKKHVEKLGVEIIESTETDNP